MWTNHKWFEKHQFCFGFFFFNVLNHWLIKYKRMCYNTGLRTYIIETSINRLPLTLNYIFQNSFIFAFCGFFSCTKKKMDKKPDSTTRERYVWNYKFTNSHLFLFLKISFSLIKKLYSLKMNFVPFLLSTFSFLNL